jgi:hypothetical protein
MSHRKKNSRPFSKKDAKDQFNLDELEDGTGQQTYTMKLMMII